MYRPIMIAALGSLLSVAAQAHHSFANFDMSKTLTVQGTVHAWEWTNPHSWLWVDVDDGKGGVVTWGFEGSAPGEMTRQGWTKHSLNVGDKISVTFRPLKNGQNGGSFGTVVLPDGTVMGKQSFLGGGGGPPGSAPPVGGPPGAPPAPAAAN